MITYIYDYLFKKKYIKCMILMHATKCYHLYWFVIKLKIYEIFSKNFIYFYDFMNFFMNFCPYLVK